jgi:hypothetical protein
MRRVTAALGVVMAVVLMAAVAVAQAKPNFSGEWKRMVERGQGEPGVDLTISQTSSAMTVEFRGGQKLTYKLDGSVSKNTIAGRGSAPTEQAAKAMWAGNTIVVITTTGAGEEKRTFSMDGGFLVVETSVPAPGGGASNITKMAYQPYQRGFGG